MMDNKFSLQDSDGISLSNRDNIAMFMLNLSRHCGFHSETYSLSVNLLDRLLSVVKVCDVQLKGASYSQIEHLMIYNTGLDAPRMPINQGIKVTVYLQRCHRIQAIQRIWFKLQMPKPPYQLKAYRASYQTTPKSLK